METTLFIEISEITARVLVYNEVDGLCHDIDVTGGYGKKSIPLHIHYLKDGEILIGEDAIVYDIEEDSRFINSIIYAKEINAVDYINVLNKKIEKLIPDLRIATIILITDLRKFRTKEFQSIFISKLKTVDLQIISIKEAMAGWFYKNLSPNQEITTLYLDYKNLYIYNLSNHTKSDAIQITSEKIPLDLNAIHEFYINILSQLHQKADTTFTKHQISQLYNSQKATIHKQLLGDKDVNIYTSIYFPPRKLVVPFKVFKEFKENWYKQLSIEGGISVLKRLKFMDKVIMSGGYDLINFLNSFSTFELPTKDYNEYLLLDGGFHFYESVLSGKDIIYKQSLEYSIGIFNDQEFYPLIEEHEEFINSYEINLILTNNQKEIQLFTKINQNIKPMYTLKIAIPQKIQRILVKIEINNDKEIEEVSYELRRL